MNKVVKLTEAKLRKIIAESIIEVLREEGDALASNGYNNEFVEGLKKAFIETITSTDLELDNGYSTYEELEVQYNGSYYYFSFDYDADFKTEHHYEPQTYDYPGCDEWELKSAEFSIGDEIRTYIENGENEEYGFELNSDGELVISLSKEEQEYINNKAQVEPYDYEACEDSYTYDDYMADRYDDLRDMGYYD